MNIENMFERHSPDAKQLETMNKLRELAKLLAKDIYRLVPAGRNRNLAVGHVEDALMRANKAIVEDTKPAPKPAPAAPTMFGGQTFPEQKWKDELRDKKLPGATEVASDTVAQKYSEELKGKIHDAWMRRVRSAGYNSRKLFSNDGRANGEELMVPYSALSNFAKGVMEKSTWWESL